MYYHDKRLQYPVRVETPDPLFARGPTNKYRDVLLNTATE